MAEARNHEAWWYWRCMRCARVVSYPPPKTGPAAPQCDWVHPLADMERVALDALRRSPQGGRDEATRLQDEVIPQYRAEIARLHEALQRIADGDVDGVGDYSECVQLYARQVLDAVRRSSTCEDAIAAYLSRCPSPERDYRARALHAEAALQHAHAELEAQRPSPERVRNGVCLLCGSGVLASGEHIRDDLPPCYGQCPSPERDVTYRPVTASGAPIKDGTVDPTVGDRLVPSSPERSLEDELVRWESIADEQTRRAEKLVKALREIRSVVGTSTEAWHLAEAALVRAGYESGKTS